MLWIKSFSAFITTLDNLINFTYFDAIDNIQDRQFDLVESIPFGSSPFTGLDHYNEKGLQPLHYAIKSGCQEAIDWILSQRPPPPINSLTFGKGRNAAHYAVIHDNAITFLKLLELGVNLDQLDVFGLPPLAYVKSDLDFDNWSNKRDDQNSFVLNTEFSPYKKTYFHYFAKDSTLKLLNYAIKMVPYLINSQDLDETTPLMLSAETGQIEATRLLLMNNADYSAIDSKHRTALHRAVLRGHLATCKLLLFDSNLIETDKDFCTENENETLASLNAQKILLNYDNEGMTPLMAAVCKGHVEIVRSLCAYPKHLDLQNEYSGDTALHYAVEIGSIEMVKILLAASVNLDPVNLVGLRPIDLVSSVYIANPIKDEIYHLLVGGT